MKIVLRKEEICSDDGGGLEIAVEGFLGDTGAIPTQIFVEYYQGKLAVRVWDGSSEDCKTTVIIPNN
jgi:hypothetical protein